MTSVDSRKDSPAVQRRSSSAVTASQRQSVSCRNSLPVTLSGAKSHKSLERKRPSEGGLKKYSGSHSTSSIPRKVVKENAEKLKAIRKDSDDINGGGDGDTFGPVTSILSFVDQPPGGHGGRGPGDARKQSLIHGMDEHEVQSEATNSLESRSNAKKENTSASAGKNENVKKPVIRKREESKANNKSAPAVKTAKTSPPAKSTSRPSTPAAKTSTGSVKSAPAPASATLRTKKQPLKQSVTAPLSDRPRTPGAGARPQLRATKSNTAPVTQMASKRTPGDLGTPRPASAAASVPVSTPAGRPVRGAGGGSQKSANQVNTLPKTGSQSKNIKAQSKASPYPKKVSSEYASEIVFKNQEGLKFSSVSFFDEEIENGQSRYNHHTYHLKISHFSLLQAAQCHAPPEAAWQLQPRGPREAGAARGQGRGQQDVAAAQDRHRDRHGQEARQGVGRTVQEVLGDQESGMDNFYTSSVMAKVRKVIFLRKVE